MGKPDTPWFLEGKDKYGSKFVFHCYIKMPKSVKWV